MRFRFGRGGSRVPIGCGALLTLLGLILLTPVGIWLIKAVGWISVFLGLFFMVSGVYYWLVRFRRRYY